MRTNERRGRLFGGSRAPSGGSPDPSPSEGPPPTRVSGRTRAELPHDPTILPELPPAFERSLDLGLAALGLSLTPGARAAIAAHVRLLLAWNAAINLTAITDPGAIAIRHVVDSLTALPFLAGGRILDLGSGGGFPGLPLAAAISAAQMTLLESVAKKAAFLETAVAGTGLTGRAAVRHERAEAVAASRARGSWDVVTVRSVGSLDDLIELALPLLDRGGRLLAWKRGDPTTDLGPELAAATRAGAALGAGPPVVHQVIPHVARGTMPSLDGHVLVEVSKVRPTPPGYPRDPAVRRRRHW